MLTCNVYWINSIVFLRFTYAVAHVLDCGPSANPEVETEQRFLTSREMFGCTTRY